MVLQFLPLKFLSIPHPQIPFPRRNPLTTSPIIANSSLPLSLTVKCSDSEQSETGNLKDALSGMVDQQVEELLKKDENKVLLDGLEKASLRVETAKRELQEIGKQEMAAKLFRDEINQLQIRAFEIAESQREIDGARLMMEEAERSLLQYADGDGTGDGEINKDAERLESIKAASISAIVGTIAWLPISLTQLTSSTTELILPLSITFVSCALFGVTFRYTVRRDLDNIQLKTGTSAAFGVVKGLGAVGAGPGLELNMESVLSHSLEGVVNVSESLLVFLFAAVALDFCFKMRLLSPFPMKTP